jgi:hypothetical protein
MSIELKQIESAERWNRYVERSPHATPFHYFGALETIADWTDGNLVLLVGVKGEEPIGIFPAIRIDVSRYCAVLSPPPDLKISYLGPALLNFQKLSARKYERRHRKFLNLCFEQFEKSKVPIYYHVTTSPTYDDLRPLQWNGFDSAPAYTFDIDLTVGRSELRQSFSRDARKNIEVAEELDRDVGIEQSGLEAIDPILDGVRARFDEQDLEFNLPTRFAEALYRRLPDGAVIPYTVTVDGQFAGGLIALSDGQTVYRWQGGVRSDVNVSTNELLDWTVMKDALAHGHSRYDLVGAEVPQINRYKNKFNPNYRPFATAERGRFPVRVAASVYNRLDLSYFG